MVKLIIAWIRLAFFISSEIIGSMAFAQKPPKVQQVSLRAPADIKIDGDASDWDSKMVAYNKNTELYYSIANDNQSLYLLIQADKSDIITKIIHSGITLAINMKEKKDKESFMMTYPRYKKGEVPLYFTMNNPAEGEPDSIKASLQIDSLINKKNQQLADRLKYIGIKNIGQTIDSILTVNNEKRIAATVRLNNKLVCTYEVSIPLKIIGLDLEKEKPFYYHIILNGLTNTGNNVEIIQTAYGERITFTGNDGKTYVLPSAGNKGMALAFSTDFWGNYTLAKSQ